MQSDEHSIAAYLSASMSREERKNFEDRLHINEELRKKVIMELSLLKLSSNQSVDQAMMIGRKLDMLRTTIRELASDPIRVQPDIPQQFVDISNIEVVQMRSNLVWEELAGAALRSEDFGVILHSPTANQCFTSILPLTYQSSVGEVLEIQLFDYKEHEIVNLKSQALTLLTRLEIDLSMLKNGRYYLWLTNNAGKQLLRCTEKVSSDI